MSILEIQQQSSNQDETFLHRPHGSHKYDVGVDVAYYLSPSGSKLYSHNSHVYESEQVSIYSVVSKEWQSSIERHTFSKIRLTPARTSESGHIIQGSRQNFVRRIDLDRCL
jgi:hypothetical protein